MSESRASMEEWLALTDLVHGQIVATLGECPDVEPASDGLCHDITDAVLAAGWRPPLSG